MEYELVDDFFADAVIEIAFGSVVFSMVDRLVGVMIEVLEPEVESFDDEEESETSRLTLVY